MTSGNGLAAIFDGNTTTTGYRQSTTGYVGAELPSGTLIDYVVIKSASNGFDASGSTSTITLTLYGKNGTPASGTDGTVLGATSFTDVNTVTSKTIYNSNKYTHYSNMWVYIQTGVWVIASELEFYETAIPSEPPVMTGSRCSRIQSMNTITPLTWSPTLIPGFCIDIKTRENPGVATLHFRADVKHENVVNDVVGISGSIMEQSGSTWLACLQDPPIRLPHAVSGQNILNVTDHYGNLNVFTKHQLSADTYYRFTILGTAHSTASPLDGLCSVLVEGSGGLNSFYITVDETEQLI